jgi:hypothetical protein
MPRRAPGLRFLVLGMFLIGGLTLGGLQLVSA